MSYIENTRIMNNIKVVCLTSAIIFLLSTCVSPSRNEERGSITDYVNVFIGTGGHGHTFPGATVPYGMVQLSPDTRTMGWDACGGYHYSDNSILGFSHTHLSGTGIGDYGDILLMPFTGQAHILPGSPEDPDSGYRSRFSHDEENASPGYYSVLLSDYDVIAELTATTRAGFHRYTFPGEKSSGFILDLNHTIHGHKNPVNEIRIISDTEIEGLKQTKGWAQNHYVYFYAQFSKPFTWEIYSDDKILPTERRAISENAKAVLHFETDADEKVLVKVGISSVDYDGARNNLQSEIPHWDFDRVRAEATEKWVEELNKVKVTGGTEDEKTIFYTALYHTCISPYVFSDADGRYRGINQKIYKNENFTSYTVFSLWDTFRAFHPLKTILDPKRNNEFIHALLSKYDEGGILPMWELAGNYTGTMIGYHAIPAIVDAYMKGQVDFDPEKAFQAMLRSPHYDTTGIYFPSEYVKGYLMPTSRYYNDKLGFVPADKVHESVSRGLEYAYNDWCIAIMARELGKMEEYEKYMERAQYYKKYFDEKTGFMRGRNADGSWKEPFNPRFSEHQWGDYCEGNAWQWTWFVPHDVPGLISLMGGEDNFIAKLDSLFSIDSIIEGESSSADISGLIGQYAHGNEPSHHIIHLYNYVGQPWKTQELADSVLSSLYFNDPDGLSGNEDCGQMSAWYILNAIGFYSFCPGDANYSIGRPVFDKVVINLENGRKFTIEAKNNSRQNKYIQSAMLNGKPLNRPFISHDDIVKGGKLIFKMGPKPNYSWGN